MYLMSALFFEKGGILFKGGHYIREDIIQGNTVIRLPKTEKVFFQYPYHWRTFFFCSEKKFEGHISRGKYFKMKAMKYFYPAQQQTTTIDRRLMLKKKVT